LQQVTQQGDNLHFVALAAAQAQAAKSTDMPDMTKTLMQDMEVWIPTASLAASAVAWGHGQVLAWQP
jgi:hypothetical protein